MPEGDVETYHRDGTWRNRIEGHSDLDGEYSTKAEARQAGREEARERGVEHIIKDADGTIAEKHSYGHDPRDIPG